MNQANPEGAAAAGPDPLRQAALELVESSNRALRQSSERVTALEVELADLRRQLQGMDRLLSTERDHRIAAEALAPTAELLRRLEASAARGTGLCRTCVAAFAGSALGAALVLTVAPLLGDGRQSVNQARTPTTDTPSTPQPQAPPLQPKPRETLQLRCVQPCWLEVREVKTGRRVYYNTLKGSTTLPIGSGLEVFSGRGDVLKIRINDGPEQRFSTIMVGKRTFMPTTFMPTPK